MDIGILGIGKMGQAVAGLVALEKGQLRATLIEAVLAATRKSQELQSPLPKKRERIV